jgi:tRNA threonylcarbamoyladenosine biosynthesis protein TsaB
VPLTLAFDTATPDTAVAVSGGRERLIGPGPDGRPAHAPALLPAIEEAVTEAGGWEAIGLIAVGLGPGSFTGVRIGVSTARALAQSRGLPVAGVVTTSALLAGIEPGEGGRLAIVDARRGEVFAAADFGDGSTEPVVAAPHELPASLGIEALAGLRAAGDGAVRFRAEIEAAGAVVPSDGDPAHRISARAICELAAEIEPAGPESIRPLYLRRPDAERWRNRDGGN